MRVFLCRALQQTFALKTYECICESYVPLMCRLGGPLISLMLRTHFESPAAFLDRIRISCNSICCLVKTKRQ